ncbi:hypothetical protein CEXT_193681 [Caerostris extrusa]|uniref:Uncharacterized protein n=1 Tax=Caerostris extrusa TaxID=172846 RepID=A0AAV4WX07_CAEEX|nr:hypothetical protein CEXT_193681 [Caerostris extrusa]
MGGSHTGEGIRGTANREREERDRRESFSEKGKVKEGGGKGCSNTQSLAPNGVALEAGMETRGICMPACVT